MSPALAAIRIAAARLPRGRGGCGGRPPRAPVFGWPGDRLTSPASGRGLALWPGVIRVADTPQAIGVATVRSGKCAGLPPQAARP
jgi:hypothetical protein